MGAEFVQQRDGETFIDYFRRACRVARIPMTRIAREALASKPLLNAWLYQKQLPKHLTAIRLDYALEEHGVVADMEYAAAKEHAFVDITELPSIEREIVVKIALGRISMRDLQEIVEIVRGESL